MQTVERRKSISLPKFAAKILAENITGAPKGSPRWKAAFEEIREGQKAHHITNRDFEGMTLDDIRRSCRLRD